MALSPEIQRFRRRSRQLAGFCRIESKCSGTAPCGKNIRANSRKCHGVSPKFCGEVGAGRGGRRCLGFSGKAGPASRVGTDGARATPGSRGRAGGLRGTSARDTVPREGGPSVQWAARGHRSQPAYFSGLCCACMSSFKFGMNRRVVAVGLDMPDARAQNLSQIRHVGVEISGASLAALSCFDNKSYK